MKQILNLAFVYDIKDYADFGGYYSHPHNIPSLIQWLPNNYWPLRESSFSSKSITFKSILFCSVLDHSWPFFSSQTCKQIICKRSMISVHLSSSVGVPVCLSGRSCSPIPREFQFWWSRNWAALFSCWHCILSLSLAIKRSRKGTHT